MSSNAARKEKSFGFSADSSAPSSPPASRDATDLALSCDRPRSVAGLVQTAGCGQTAGEPKAKEGEQTVTELYLIKSEEVPPSSELPLKLHLCRPGEADTEVSTSPRTPSASCGGFASTLGIERLMTAEEVAAALRRPVRHIYRLARCRQLIAMRDGRRVLFRRADVEQYIKSKLALPTKQHQQLLERAEAVRLALVNGSGSRTRR